MPGKFWQQMAPRERLAVALAAAIVGLAALWWLALTPALATLRQAPSQRERLMAEVQDMQAMASQARQLQSHSAVSRDDALRALESATQRHFASTAKLNVLGDQATVTLQGAAPLALAHWLADVRANARLAPAEAHLQRQAAADPAQPATNQIATGKAGTNAPANAVTQPGDAPGVSWSGTLVLALPR